MSHSEELKLSLKCDQFVVTDSGEPGFPQLSPRPRANSAPIGSTGTPIKGKDVPTTLPALAQKPEYATHYNLARHAFAGVKHAKRAKTYDSAPLNDAVAKALTAMHAGVRDPLTDALRTDPPPSLDVGTQLAELEAAIAAVDAILEKDRFAIPSFFKAQTRAFMRDAVAVKERLENYNAVNNAGHQLKKNPKADDLRDHVRLKMGLLYGAAITGQNRLQDLAHIYREVTDPAHVAYMALSDITDKHKRAEQAKELAAELVASDEYQRWVTTLNKDLPLIAKKVGLDQHPILLAELERSLAPITGSSPLDNTNRYLIMTQLIGSVIAIRPETKASLLDERLDELLFSLAAVDKVSSPVVAAKLSAFFNDELHRLEKKPDQHRLLQLHEIDSRLALGPKLRAAFGKRKAGHILKRLNEPKALGAAIVRAERTKRLLQQLNTDPVTKDFIDLTFQMAVSPAQRHMVLQGLFDPNSKWNKLAGADREGLCKFYENNFVNASMPTNKAEKKQFKAGAALMRRLFPALMAEQIKRDLGGTTAVYFNIEAQFAKSPADVVSLARGIEKKTSDDLTEMMAARLEGARSTKHHSKLLVTMMEAAMVDEDVSGQLLGSIDAVLLAPVTDLERPLHVLNSLVHFANGRYDQIVDPKDGEPIEQLRPRAFACLEYNRSLEADSWETYPDLTRKIYDLIDGYPKPIDDPTINKEFRNRVAALKKSSAKLKSDHRAAAAKLDRHERAKARDNVKRMELFVGKQSLVRLMFLASRRRKLAAEGVGSGFAAYAYLQFDRLATEEGNDSIARAIGGDIGLLEVLPWIAPLGIKDKDGALAATLGEVHLAVQRDIATRVRVEDMETVKATAEALTTPEAVSATAEYFDRVERHNQVAAKFCTYEQEMRKQNSSWFQRNKVDPADLRDLFDASRKLKAATSVLQQKLGDKPNDEEQKKVWAQKGLALMFSPENVEYEEAVASFYQVYIRMQEKGHVERLDNLLRKGTLTELTTSRKPTNLMNGMNRVMQELEMTGAELSKELEKTRPGSGLPVRRRTDANKVRMAAMQRMQSLQQMKRD